MEADSIWDLLFFKPKIRRSARNGELSVRELDTPMGSRDSGV